MDSFKVLFAPSLKEIAQDAGKTILDAAREAGVYIDSQCNGKGKCGKCPRWAVCRGCRAVAWAASAARGKADYLAPDPQCFLGN